ncbi:hypothetical protein [Bradyrhizobium erythrophlei]|uniref:Uncharacterized protein n=1 Tax=Bradyrhizobium erythrophlei TaxID=1437360 RepID=A0A1M5NJX2_9BRAD|nr:hypothetical protein [Bradyrhizobium erythrophlei]SHG89747.1 hypothetical protein SAMN05443248_3022 [Bradyrhizobium erythrophlei]
MPKHPSETKTDWLKRLARVAFDQCQTPPYFDGMFAISTGVIKVDRKMYPTQVYLRIKTGNDENRVSTQIDMTWKEVERLHDQLGAALKQRAALKKKLEPYRDGYVAP